MPRSTIAPELRRCFDLLPTVSRTFALTIRILPWELRRPVTIAYLLCRMADVLEDATGIDPGPRIEGLESMAVALALPGADARSLARSLDVAAALPIGEASGLRLFRERALIFQAYAGLPPEQREIVSRWVQAMALGMAGHVGRETRPAPFVLDTTEELRAYAYYVAGTVGHLLTELFALHLGSKVRRVEPRLRELAVPFGLGLQFTNIVQDLAEDRRRGWCYIPEEIAARHGTRARDLVEASERAAALRAIGDVVKEAARYLDHAMEFTLLLPRAAPRIRLFCLWPTFFAVRTLTRIWGEERVLLPGSKVRISRNEVRGVIGATSLACPWNGLLERLYRRERMRLRRRIALHPV